MLEQNSVSPLAGVRVIDFTTNVSGPTATAILADLGADVIKIERMGRGDDARGMSPKVENESVYFLAVYRNKRSLALDFTRPEGLEIVNKLISGADVVVENFRRGTLNKYGLDAATLGQKYSRLIYCSISAYGEQGAEQNKPGYDALLQARTGIMSITGSHEGEPSRAGISVLDAGSGMWATIGILTALYRRALTGKGERLGTSLLETGIYWMNYYLAAYQVTHRNPTPQGADHAAFSPYGAFHTADGILMIGVANDELFEKLVKSLDYPDWANSDQFATNASRVEHRKALEKLLTKILITRSSEQWIERFERAGVPFSPIQNVSQVLQDPQINAVNMLHPLIRYPELRIPLAPIRFFDSKVSTRADSPRLGEHTQEVLAEIGISPDIFHQLQQQGVVQ